MRKAVYLLAIFLCSTPGIAAPEKQAASVMVPVGAFDDASIAPVREKIDELVKNGEKQIILHIDSNGGSIDTGWEFNNFLVEKKKAGIRVSCFVNWKAFSMGAFLLESACDDRWVAPNGTILFHEGKTEAAGRVSDLLSEAAFLDNLNKGIVRITAKRIGMSEAEFTAKIHEGDWTMDAEGAIKAHAADAIKENRDMPPLATLKPKKMSILDILLGGKH